MRIRYLLSARNCLLFLTVALSSLNATWAFEIAAYGDTRSGMNYNTQGCSGNGDSMRTVMLPRIRLHEQTVFNWLDSLGVTQLQVYYPHADDYTDLQSRNLGDMKLLNFSWPGEAFKYICSQQRVVEVGHDGADWVKSDYWGEHALPVVYRKTGLLVLAEGPSISGLSWQPETMWEPSGWSLGQWQGWLRREAMMNDTATFMPLHIRVEFDAAWNDTCTACDTPFTVATVYFMVQQEPWESNYLPINNGWWRYPGFEVVIDPNDVLDQFRDTTCTISTHPDSGNTFILLDAAFAEVLDDSGRVITSSNHRFGGGDIGDGRGVTMQIDYHGHHDLYLREVQIWDEGHHQLFIASDSVRNTTKYNVQSAFADQLSASDGKQVGWYFDEWALYPGTFRDPSDVIHSMAQVNRYLNEASPLLPTFVYNGHPGLTDGPNCFYPRNALYCAVDSADTPLPVMMMEFYPWGNSPTCTPFSSYYYLTMGMKTATSSDEPYLDIDGSCASFTDCGNQERRHGTMSPQCALDGLIWGHEPIYNLLGLNHWWETCGSDPRLNSLVAQVEHAHSHGSMFWNLIPANDDIFCPDTLDNGEIWDGLRQPTPNEVKLAAWLSVAADADGIMWYGLGGPGSGLIRWENDTIPDVYADDCGGRLLYEDVQPQLTDRYAAAFKVCHDIQRIAPALEPLDFVKTYASRAFEHNYPYTPPWPDGELSMIYMDTLYEQDSRVCRVSRIATSTNGGSLDEDLEDADSTYVQVSRFMTKGTDPTVEDYWFLIVNRRALPQESRVVFLSVDGLENPQGSYLYDRVLAGICTTAIGTCGSSSRKLRVSLNPGEAELVHFFRADTSDLVITTDTTIYAPVYFHRNVVVRDTGSLTIVSSNSAPLSYGLAGSILDGQNRC